MKMIAALAPFAAALVLATAGAAMAEDSKPAYDLGKLYGEIRQIVRRHSGQSWSKSFTLPHTMIYAPPDD